VAIAKNGTIGVDRRFENETQLTLVLAASGETISVEAYLDRILQVISEMVAQTFDSPLCSIMILDESRQQLTIKAARYLGPSLPGVTPISVEGSVIGRVVRERQMIIVENIPGEEAFPELCLVPKFVTLLSVPLIASHTLTIPSSLPVTIRWPSGEKATEPIQPLCPLRVNSSLPPSAFQTLAV
jgi:hypothetical protein